MVDSTELTKSFVRNFIRKDKRERCMTQLLGKNRRKFTDDLNHNWENLFNMALLQELSRNDHNYGAVQKLLKMSDKELCYIISDESMDGTFLSFREAYDRVDFANFGTLLIDESATKMFFKTEQIQGYAPRFVGVCEFVGR